MGGKKKKVFRTAGSQKWTKTAQRFEDRTDHTTPLEVPQSLYRGDAKHSPVVFWSGIATL